MKHRLYDVSAAGPPTETGNTPTSTFAAGCGLGSGDDDGSGAVPTEGGSPAEPVRPQEQGTPVLATWSEHDRASSADHAIPGAHRTGAVRGHRSASADLRGPREKGRDILLGLQSDPSDPQPEVDEEWVDGPAAPCGRGERSNSPRRHPRGLSRGCGEQQSQITSLAKKLRPSVPWRGVGVGALEVVSG